jgi:predicted  nucleic acid-binding Zn-ribbon protein
MGGSPYIERAEAMAEDVTQALALLDPIREAFDKLTQELETYKNMHRLNTQAIRVRDEQIRQLTLELGRHKRLDEV